MVSSYQPLLFSGANQGLGYEAARALLQTPGPDGLSRYHVLLGCRDAAKGRATAAELEGLAPGSVTPLLLDVTSEATVAAAAAEVRARFGRLDVLVNNAGVISQAASAGERLEAAWDVNVRGVVRVTEAFLPLLLPPSGSGARREGRLVFVGSSMGSLTGSADPNSRYYKSVTGASPMEYRVSKAALNMVMLEYWKKYGIHEGGPLRVFTADPGPNATNFMGDAEHGRRMGLPGPEVGAQQLVKCVTGERDGGEGKMWGAYGESPW
ncbi:uncharacterized protein JN550_005173 [Neoarthrinium moseri]|uniref:uncharacterized protein n=1 Tax=Neoarthrinium moseri TaxID=1658444 RepID=UPI001FDD034B|nr:uncharacterized protein JN550_005173 [Neoarthrinium moseri]KAI1870630.1 hypothetical protein JN550_005173 [Neoarthrinium moseri]